MLELVLIFQIKDIYNYKILLSSSFFPIPFLDFILIFLYFNYFFKYLFNLMNEFNKINFRYYKNYMLSNKTK